MRIIATADRVVHLEKLEFASAFLRRHVRLDTYLPDPVEDPSDLRLLLFNDGQDVGGMGLPVLLEQLQGPPVLCVGIHAGKDRLSEYGTAARADYKGRGSKAFLYTHFIVQELLPFLEKTYRVTFAERAFAGFSLGGLSAMDIVWNHPHLFRTAGVFSGSFWWRFKGYDDGYSEETDRIMHAQVRSGRGGSPEQRFFFECGTADETADRNHNGVIDVIDDTLDLIGDMEESGIPRTNIHYLEVPGGKHDKDTWAAALPEFLEWGWGR
ncbi:alpha/beta hydrolase [Dinghuibacter silviterrae]|uniref:Putative alpha/beta superfamily hydrolase n=1 Tax=Dinghuibacter silviterrae TaxID=1539049 RepID=A0A4R8DS25_9BACT|nr:alpha/beta hydrolase-fold protein [Dinghuibacter silviterrae]TDX01044.1 putative alpha/beta superfamily hydrolase [Dinghuibacter silviterrae]